MEPHDGHVTKVMANDICSALLLFLLKPDKNQHTSFEEGTSIITFLVSNISLQRAIELSTKSLKNINLMLHLLPEEHKHACPSPLQNVFLNLGSYCRSKNQKLENIKD